MALIEHTSEKKIADNLSAERSNAVSSDPTTAALSGMAPDDLDAYIDGLTNFTEVRDLVKHLARIVLTK